LYSAVVAVADAAAAETTLLLVPPILNMVVDAGYAALLMWL
jgi:hypothetical protein